MQKWIVTTENRGLVPEHFRPYCVTDETGQTVIARLPDGRGPQDKAKANLIAAAPDLLAALEIAQDHLAQYRRYSEEMRSIGRGLMISSPYQEETADCIIRKAIERATA